jgi:uncharacterized protein
VAIVIPDTCGRKHGVLNVSIAIIAISLFALSFSFLSGSAFDHHTTVTEVYAQHNVETVKHRDLTIELGNGLKTNAQLTIPTVGEGPFPGILLIPGSGPQDLNETAGFILVDNETGSKTYPAAQPLFQIAEYYSERGFVVLRYDKRGVGANYTLDSNVWGNLTINDLIQDADTALSVLLQQPEVNASQKATLIGHSEGTTIVPRVAVKNPEKVKNVVLMGPLAQNPINDVQFYQEVEAPYFYAQRILDKDHQGSISVKEASEDPIFQRLINQASGTDLADVLLFTQSNVTDIQNRTAQLQPTLHKSNASFINIENELKPALIASYENHTSAPASVASAKCLNLMGCPAWVRSHSNLETALSMIGNVSSGTGVLIMVGENDSQTPVEQGLLLQQRLTEVNHPDHLLFTYPNLGHTFSPSNEWVTSFGPIEEYVLQDLFEWLVSPARDVSEEIR